MLKGMMVFFDLSVKLFVPVRERRNLIDSKEQSKPTVLLSLFKEGEAYHK